MLSLTSRSRRLASSRPDARGLARARHTFRVSGRPRTVSVRAEYDHLECLDEVEREMDHLRSKVDQQATVLQELLATREQAEAEAPVSSTSSTTTAGVLETPYLDIQSWAAPAQPREVRVLWLRPLQDTVSIRSIPLQQPTSAEDQDSVVMGIELCLAGIQLPGSNPEAVPLTIKKGSTLRIDSLDEPFGSYPHKLQLEADVVGAIGHGHRLQAIWHLDKLFLHRCNLLAKPPRSTSAGRKREYEVKGTWRVSFEVSYELGTAE